MKEINYLITVKCRWLVCVDDLKMCSGRIEFKTLIICRTSALFDRSYVGDRWAQKKTEYF